MPAEVELDAVAGAEDDGLIAEARPARWSRAPRQLLVVEGELLAHLDGGGAITASEGQEVHGVLTPLAAGDGREPRSTAARGTSRSSSGRPGGRAGDSRNAEEQQAKASQRTTVLETRGSGQLTISLPWMSNTTPAMMPAVRRGKAQYDGVAVHGLQPFEALQPKALAGRGLGSQPMGLEEIHQAGDEADADADRRPQKQDGVDLAPEVVRLLQPTGPGRRRAACRTGAPRLTSPSTSGSTKMPQLSRR